LTSKNNRSPCEDIVVLESALEDLKLADETADDPLTVVH
jgi:hypothetical protein